MPQVELCLLIAKQPIMPLYQGAGFTAVGLSGVVHGKDPWYELKHEFIFDHPTMTFPGMRPVSVSSRMVELPVVVPARARAPAARHEQAASQQAK